MNCGEPCAHWPACPCGMPKPDDVCPLCGIHRRYAGYTPESCGPGLHKPGCFVKPEVSQANKEMNQSDPYFVSER